MLISKKAEKSLNVSGGGGVGGGGGDGGGGKTAAKLIRQNLE